MTTNHNTFNERVVKMEETCDGDVARTFYCVHDPDFGHWMSHEPFDGYIWTKDVSCRREFDSREEAKATLVRFLKWRRQKEKNDRRTERVIAKREVA
jgi:hypothetical protein